MRRGKAEIRLETKGTKVYALRADGERYGEVPVRRDGKVLFTAACGKQALAAKANAGKILSAIVNHDKIELLGTAANRSTGGKGCAGDNGD